MIMTYLKKLWNKCPKPDSISLSWPPAINFPFKKDKTQNNLQQFQQLAEKAKWRKELIDSKEVWLCEEDNTYQIEIGESSGEFHEKWTQVYPDHQNVSGHHVYLKINNTIIREITFVSCDGGRIFVPSPEIQSEQNQVVYIWRKDSLPYKLCRIIGKYYIHKTIEGVARMSKISII